MIDYRDDDLMTVAEVARYLGVTRHTVYRWIAMGQLPALRVSRKVIRVRRSDVAAAGGAPPTVAIREPRATYEAELALSDADAERERRRIKRLLAEYREMRDRPRSPDEPPRGSPAALLRHVGRISHEDAEELRRVIREAKTYSPPIEL
jgi:excisionase family DNA binding protein